MRSGGILMHITSLPSAGGIGDLGKEAYAFADFLHQSGMRIWQVLPVCPTGYGESPYQSPSAFAGNPLMISPERMMEEGFLSCNENEIMKPEQADRIDFDAVRLNKTALLKKAWLQSRQRCMGDLDAFVHENPWAGDYALFAAVKNHFDQKMWSQWPDSGIRNKLPGSVTHYREKLKEEINFHLFCQYIFRRQWLALKKYCNERSILILGDMPIYVAEDSADTWTHPEVFQLDRNLIPTRVAGVPPDYFSEDGQLWGNPLYRWHFLWWKRYGWWVERMKCMSTLFDVVRIDHFIGFANYYSIPYGAPNARRGKWIPGPGIRLFKRLRKEIPGMRIVAEDLGERSTRVEKLTEWCGYPGMRILCYGFGGDEKTNEHFPANYPRNCVAYTGTHDNDTVRGWAEKTDAASLAKAMSTLGFSTPAEAPWAFVKAVFASECETAVAPMQDILGLGGDARMNFPGTVGGNWGWRMMPGALTNTLIEKLNRLNHETHRC